MNEVMFLVCSCEGERTEDDERDIARKETAGDDRQAKKPGRQGRTCPDTVDQVRSPPAIHVDYELYEHYLDDPRLSEDQKREFLQALWTIICEFVALGFGVHPAQQAQESCGQLPNIGRKAPESAPIAVDCKDQSIIKSFVEAADL